MLPSPGSTWVCSALPGRTHSPRVTTTYAYSATTEELLTVNYENSMVKQGEFFFRGHHLNNSAAPVFDTLTITPSGGTGVNHDAYLPQANEDFTYDDDGNLLSDGRWNYTYDGYETAR